MWFAFDIFNIYPYTMNRFDQISGFVTNNGRMTTILVFSAVSLGFLYHTSISRPIKVTNTSSSIMKKISDKTSLKPVEMNVINDTSLLGDKSQAMLSQSIGDMVIRKWMDIWVAGGSYPGLMLSIIKDNKEIFYHEVGYADVENKKQVIRDCIYRIYSMTKPITALATLILVDRGLLKLNDEVASYIPSFRNQKVLVGGTYEDPILEDIKHPMTIHHLLTHTSGITYGIFGNHLHDMLLRKSFTPEDCKVWFSNLTTQELCDRIASSPLSFQPGTAFLYGLSSDILGYIIEIISQKSLRDFFIDEIFTPLQMYDTDFYINEDNMHRLVECYEVIPGNQYIISSNPERRRDRIPILQAGGGGLVSTIDDYTKFVSCLLRNCTLPDGTMLLSESLYHAMISNQLPDDKDLVELSIDNAFSESIGEGVGYGYGVSVLVNPMKCKGGQLSSIGEYGWGGVASTWFLIDPIRQQAVILMANLLPSSAYPIRSQLRALYQSVC